MITSKLEQIKNKIRNMPMDEFCSCVNKLARATRYCAENRKVCEILDVRNSTIKVVHLDPDYFGSETAYMTIEDELDNAFKELFIQGMLSGWDDYQDDYVSNFGD